MSTQDIPTRANWRALCEELLEALEVQLDELRFDNRLCKRARAALAQPEPVGPTVMEIIAMADEIEEEGLGQIDLVRRALARWGGHTSQEDYKG